ncbi:MAG: hypothetical protein GWN58_04045, partial [Anaerolineae bacterium]|nr:hypothetical protein [Anaerolineae bacterium]
MQRSNKTLTMTGILLALLVLSGLALLSTQSAPALADVPAGATLAETNKLLVQRAYYEVLSNGNLAVADEIFAPTFQHHLPGFSAIPIGPEGCKLLTMVYHAAFPDLKYTVEDIVAEGDEVVTRWRASGSHEDFFGPQAPSGERITWTGITIHRLADGQIVDEWTSQDTL